MSMTRHWLVLLAASVTAASLWAAEPAAPPPQQSAKPLPDQAGKPAEPTTTAAKPEAKPASVASAAAKPETSKPETAPEAGKPETAQAAAKATEKAKPPTDDKSSPQRFIPSEQVRPDFDVSYPIDI